MGTIMGGGVNRGVLVWLTIVVVGRRQFTAQ